MTLVVAKPFNTHLQRFRVGDPVDEGMTLAPHDLADLKKRKFVVDEKKTAAAK